MLRFTLDRKLSEIMEANSPPHGGGKLNPRKKGSIDLRRLAKEVRRKDPEVIKRQKDTLSSGLGQAAKVMDFAEFYDLSDFDEEEKAIIYYGDYVSASPGFRRDSNTYTFNKEAYDFGISDIIEIAIESDPTIESKLKKAKSDDQVATLLHREGLVDSEFVTSKFQREYMPLYAEERGSEEFGRKYRGIDDVIEITDPSVMLKPVISDPDSKSKSKPKSSGKVGGFVVEFTPESDAAGASRAPEREFFGVWTDDKKGYDSIESAEEAAREFQAKMNGTLTPIQSQPEGVKRRGRYKPFIPDPVDNIINELGLAITVSEIDPSKLTEEQRELLETAKKHGGARRYLKKLEQLEKSEKAKKKEEIPYTTGAATADTHGLPIRTSARQAKQAELEGKLQDILGPELKSLEDDDPALELPGGEAEGINQTAARASEFNKGVNYGREVKPEEHQAGVYQRDASTGTEKYSPEDRMYSQALERKRRERQQQKENENK